MAKLPLREWDSRFMTMLTAGGVADWSKDPDEGVAALLVSPDRRRFSIGYNGLPHDCHVDYENTAAGDKGFKNRITRHAERNAISNAGCDLTGWTLYCTKAPCVECALEIHAHRIARVVCPRIRADSRWAKDQGAAIGFLMDHGVRVDYADRVDHAA